MQKEKIETYFNANPDLRVLFVFDPIGDVLSEVEALVWAAPYRVVRFAGDWFATKCLIADLLAAEKLILLMPMTSPLGFEDRMREFPLLGELCANAQYSDDDYHAFMTLRGLPETCSAFVRAHLSDLQLTKFDKVLGGSYGTQFTSEIGCRGLLSVLLGESGLREWRDILVKVVTLDAEDSTSKKKLSFFNAILTDSRYPDALAALQAELKKTFGAEMDPNKDPHLCKAAASLRYNSVVQELPTLATDNYKALRTTDGVVLNRMNQFLQYAADLPDAKRNDFFKAFERLSGDIHMSHLTQTYGAEANFGAYPPKLCQEILVQLSSQDIAKIAASARERTDFISQRTEAGVRMRRVAAFVAAAAGYYVHLAKVKTFKLSSPGEYVVNYASDWFELDRSYRLAVEKFYAIATDEDRQIFEQMKKKLDGDYALKATESNSGWMEALKAAGGTASLTLFTRQEDFYKQIGDSSVKHAVIISDGLRYEVAKEIEERINSGRHKAVLKPGIAMLPSETKYCKPILLPHGTARFCAGPDCDAQIDDKWASSKAQRNEIISYYDPNGACVSTAELSQMTQFEKRELFKRPLVYVYHDVIDDASHQKPGKDVVKACRDAVEELVQLIASIHGTYNVGDVLLVSDHGFLMNDVEFDEKDKIPVEASENPLEKTTRYYLTNSTATIHGVTKFPLKTVSAFADETLVAVPDGTSRFSAPGGYVYAHGGAALQELVIPILRSQCLRPDAREKVGVSLVNSKLQVLSSQLKVKLLQNEVATATVQGRKVVCGLYANDALVTAEKYVTLDSADTDPNARVQTVELTLTGNPGTGILQLKVFDESDRLNPLVLASVTNCTLIERDF